MITCVSLFLQIVFLRFLHKCISLILKHVFLCLSQLYFSAPHVRSNWWWFREWGETSNFYVVGNPDYRPTLFAAPSIPLAAQLRALILDWEVSEVVLEVQTGEKRENLANISPLLVRIKAFIRVDIRAKTMDDEQICAWFGKFVKISQHQQNYSQKAQYSLQHSFFDQNCFCPFKFPPFPCLI